MIPQSEFDVDVRKRLRSIWSQANQPGNENQMDETAKYHNCFALPLGSVTADGLPFSVPKYLHLDLGRQTQRNLARFRLQSPSLCVETRSWEHHDGTCDKFGLQAIQEEKYTIFLCPCMHVFFEASICRLVSRFTTDTQNYCQSDWSYLLLSSLF